MPGSENTMKWCERCDRQFDPKKSDDEYYCNQCNCFLEAD